MHSLRSSLPLTIAILMAASTPLPGQASPNMAPGYQQTYDRMLQQIRQIAILDDHGHPGFADDSAVRFQVARQRALEDPEILQRNLGECLGRNAKILGKDLGGRMGEPIRHQ